VPLGGRSQPGDVPRSPVLPLARRIGKKKAAVAVGHSILVIAWYLVTNDADYLDLGGDDFVKRDAERARSRAISQLEALGYRVTLEPIAA
jgi:hypothetical protein